MHMGDWAPHGKGEGVGSECGTPHPNPAPWYRAQMLAWREFPSPRWPQFPRLHPGWEELTLPWTVGRDQWRPTHAGLCPGLFKAEPRDHLPQSCCGKDQSVCLHTRYHNHITHNRRRGEPPQRPRSHHSQQPKGRAAPASMVTRMDRQTVGSSCDGILFSFKRKEADTGDHTDEPRGHSAESDRPVTEAEILQGPTDVRRLQQTEP